jgi:hypothetical protein
MVALSVLVCTANMMPMGDHKPASSSSSSSSSSESDYSGELFNNTSYNGTFNAFTMSILAGDRACNADQLDALGNCSAVIADDLLSLNESTLSPQGQRVIQQAREFVATIRMGNFSIRALSAGGGYSGESSSSSEDEQDSSMESSANHSSRALGSLGYGMGSGAQFFVGGANYSKYLKEYPEEARMLTDAACGGLRQFFHCGDAAFAGSDCNPLVFRVVKVVVDVVCQSNFYKLVQQNERCLDKLSDNEKDFKECTSRFNETAQERFSNTTIDGAQLGGVVCEITGGVLDCLALYGEDCNMEAYSLNARLIGGILGAVFSSKAPPAQCNFGAAQAAGSAKKLSTSESKNNEVRKM